MKILIRPKSALQNVPNGKILVSGIVIILLFVASFSIWQFKFIENKTISLLFFSMGVFGGAVILFIGTYILSFVLSLFGVKVAFEKTINIVGFAHFPVLVITLLTIILFSIFSVLHTNSIYINIADLAIRLVSYYTLILIIYGIWLEHKANTMFPSSQTSS